MRKPIIAGNWKMNNTSAAAQALIEELKPLCKNAKCEVVICVPFTLISLAAAATKGSNIRVGAQNVAWADKGAFTGEVSAEMLKEAGAEYVIIGHSERRQMFGETDESVNKRTIQALKYGLKPIVCVGETEQEKIGGKTDEVNRRQTIAALKGITKEQLDNVVIAYEPVWAIGTGKTATADDADTTIGLIRGVVAELFDAKTAGGLRIQYGGSMNAANCDELMAKEHIDGGLIGGASLKAADFSRIVSSAK